MLQLVMDGGPGLLPKPMTLMLKDNVTGLLPRYLGSVFIFFVNTNVHTDVYNAFILDLTSNWPASISKQVPSLNLVPSNLL
jgi:hypothetical protein